MLTKDAKLRFWCQKVLPLVYDDSLSYYELLNKVVLHLNQHTEDINQLIDFYVTFAEEVEDVIEQMIEDGDFNEIVADTIGSLVAEEYDPTKSYIIFDYCIFQSKLYRANGSTTGVFDPEKWDEKTVGYDLTTIQNYIYSLNAGNISYNGSATYESGTVGKEIKDLNDDIDSLNAGDVAYDSTASYASGTVGNKLKNLNANDVSYDSTETYNNGTAGKELKDLNSAINNTKAMISVWIETTSIASRQYNVGDYLIKPPYLYRVTATINIGETLSGSNLLSVRIGEELTGIKQATTYQIQGNNVRAAMKNGVVNFTAVGGVWQDDGSDQHNLQWASTATGTFVTAVLSEDIRPYFPIEIVCSNIARRVTIGTNGYLTTDSSLTPTALRFSGTWISARAI